MSLCNNTDLLTTPFILVSRITTRAKSVQSGNPAYLSEFLCHLDSDVRELKHLAGIFRNILIDCLL